MVPRKHHYRQHQRNRSDRLVLPLQKRLCPLADRVRDRPHLRRAGVHPNHRARQQPRRRQRQHAHPHRNPQNRSSIIAGDGGNKRPRILNRHCQKSCHNHAKLSFIPQQFPMPTKGSLHHALSSPVNALSGSSTNCLGGTLKICTLLRPQSRNSSVATHKFNGKRDFGHVTLHANSPSAPRRRYT